VLHRPVESATESRQSELVVIFGEDVAAEVGLSLALAAVLAAIITGNPLYDALGSIAIGVVLIVVAAGIAVKIKGLLIGQSAEPETERAIRAFLEQREEISRVFRLITFQLGGTLMVAVKAQMHGVTAVEVVDSINRVEVAFREAFPDVQWLFFEPDVAD
jgi:divalent metal cation (Fe/Co/Zn/Cd) transporter